MNNNYLSNTLNEINNNELISNDIVQGLKYNNRRNKFKKRLSNLVDNRVSNNIIQEGFESKIDTLEVNSNTYLNNTKTSFDSEIQDYETKLNVFINSPDDIQKRNDYIESYNKLQILLNDLGNKITMMENERNNLKEEKISYSENNDNMLKKYKATREQLESINNKNPTILAMIQDFESKKNIKNYRYILWLILALITGLFTIKKLR